MKHSGYSNKESWYKEGYKNCKARQIEMIKRNYPDYSENDWVLWIVADLFHNLKTYDLTGTISIQKKDGSLIETPFMLRTPYPNKRIHQLSMKNGRKRLYGIPLVFNTFEELCEISEITIRWDFCEEWYLEGEHDKPFDLHAKCVIVKYHLNFEKDNKNPDNHFFTVFTRDNTYDAFIGDNVDDKKNRIDEYYNEFDIALNVAGVIVCEDQEWELIIGDVYNYKCKINDEKEGCHELTCAEKKVLDELYTIMPNKEKVSNLLKDVQCDSEIQWEAYCYEKAETLTAEYMADILTESSFGFANIE